VIAGKAKNLVAG